MNCEQKWCIFESARAVSFWHGDRQHSRWRQFSQLGLNGYHEEKVPADPLRVNRINKQILAFSATEIWCYYYRITQPNLLLSSIWTTKFKNREKEKKKKTRRKEEHNVISGLWRHLADFLISPWCYGKVVFPRLNLETAFLVVETDPCFSPSRGAWGRRDMRASYIHGHNGHLGKSWDIS